MELVPFLPTDSRCRWSSPS